MHAVRLKIILRSRDEWREWAEVLLEDCLRSFINVENNGSYGGCGSRMRG